MTGEHAELVAELRALAETVLERIEPILQKAAAGAEDPAGDRCSSCSWCPLCALAALIRGEQHDLVTAVAGHASALLVVLREILDGHRHPEAGADDVAKTPNRPDPGGVFVPIDITIRE